MMAAMNDTPRWDLVATQLEHRLHQLGWDGKKVTVRDYTGVNERLSWSLLGREPLRGTPSDATLATVSKHVGWAHDGIARLLDGDPTGADVVQAKEATVDLLLRRLDGMEDRLSRLDDGLHDLAARVQRLER